MNREELVQKLDAVIHNLNEDGLSLMYELMGDTHEIKKYNINTTPEQVAQIKLQEAEVAAREAATKKEKQHAECMKRMAEEVKAQKELIESLTGKEKAFWDKIEKAERMVKSRYTMKYWQLALMSKIYKNNYLNASYKTFCYGFHQGMMYMKNLYKKNETHVRGGVLRSSSGPSEVEDGCVRSERV